MTKEEKIKSLVKSIEVAMNELNELVRPAMGSINVDLKKTDDEYYFNATYYDSIWITVWHKNNEDDELESLVINRQKND